MREKVPVKDEDLIEKLQTLNWWIQKNLELREMELELAKERYKILREKLKSVNDKES